MGGGDMSKEGSQMVVYKGPQSVEGKLARPPAMFPHCPWGPVGRVNAPAASLSPSPSLQQQGDQMQGSSAIAQVQQPALAMVLCGQPSGWSWGMVQVQLQPSWGATSWGWQTSGGWPGCGFT